MARGKVRSLLELSNDRKAWAARMMRGTEVAKANVRLALQSGHQAFGEPRLADAGFSGEKQDPAFAKLGLLPTTSHQIELLLPIDEWRQPPGAPGAESADAGWPAAPTPRLGRL